MSDHPVSNKLLRMKWQEMTGYMHLVRQLSPSNEAKAITNTNDNGYVDNVTPLLFIIT